MYLKKYKKIGLFIQLFILLNSLILISNSVNSQNEIDISGPVEAFENEVVEFYVTYNGGPVEARVVFETLSDVKFSNETTGLVSFTLSNNC